jgi:hypothetical protein
VKRLLFVLILACFASPQTVFAVAANADGTRTYTVGASGDFPDWVSVVWGHPSGVLHCDKLPGGMVFFNDTTGEYEFLPFAMRGWLLKPNPQYNRRGVWNR